MRLVCKATKEEFPAGAAKETLPSVSQTWRGYSCRAWLMDERSWPGEQHRAGHASADCKGVGPTPAVYTHPAAWVLLDAHPYATEATQSPLG